MSGHSKVNVQNMLIILYYNNDLQMKSEA